MTPTAPSRPNIVYLHSHDSGRSLSPYGAPVETPRLERLAAEGVLFRQAFSAAPTCSPSRAGLLTGQNPHSAGMLGLAHRGHSLSHPERHLARLLSDAGYESVLAGLQHLTEGDPAEHGYTRVLGAPKQADDAETAAAAYLRSAPGGPFFLDVGFFETHRHMGAHGGTFNPEGPGPTREDTERYGLPPGLHDTPETRLDFADYALSARRLDDKIGVVLDALEEAGLREDTLVLYTTDHGIPFPGAKTTPTDGGLGVALILSGPPAFRGGRETDALVSHLDVHATLCEAAGVAAPPWAEGVSLLPLAEGRVTRVREEVFGEVNTHVVSEPSRTVRTAQHRYVRHFPARATSAAQNIDDGPSKQALAREDRLVRDLPQEQLFDLAADPDGTHDVAGDPAYAAVLKDLRARVEDWMTRTDDPLLTGAAPA